MATVDLCGLCGNTKYMHKPCSPTNRPLRRAYTLSELLIVGSIIVILSLLLLPLIGLMRSQARAVACLSNLRQIGLGHLLYTQDWRGAIAPAWPRWGGSWIEGLHEYIPRPEDGSDDRNLMRCPVTIRQFHDSQLWWLQFGKRYGGYAMQSCLDTRSFDFCPGGQRNLTSNWHVTDNDTHPHWKYAEFRMSQVADCSNRLLVTEADLEENQLLLAGGQAGNLSWYVGSPIGDLRTWIRGPGQHFRPAPGSGIGWGRPTMRHDGRAGVLYCDGRVEFAVVAKILTAACAPDELPALFP